MGNIEQFTKDGNDIYPVTTPDAVRDENGTNLRKVIADIQDTIGDPNDLQTEAKKVVDAINEVKQGGGGGTANKPWDEVLEGTLDTDAILALRPQKPFYRAILTLKKPSGSASSTPRFMINGPNGGNGGFITSSFSVNIQIDILVTGGCIKSIMRTYNDAQTIYGTTASMNIDELYGSKNDISIQRIATVSALPAGLTYSLKVMYL